MSGTPAPTPVEALVRRRIADAGPIPFSEFMELALYAPGAGYYARDAATTGPAGDFSTSPDVSPAFGRCLARQAQDVHERLGGGAWSLVELGPGRGLLAHDLLAALREEAPASWEALDRVVLVERSDALARALAVRVGTAAPPGRLDVVPALGASGLDGADGFVIANELLDALPVHIVERGADGLGELHVGMGEGGALGLVVRPPSDTRLAAHVARHGLCARTGWRAEICLALDDVFADVARAIGRGAALFVDYGHEVEELASAARADGTLVCYRDHAVSPDPLVDPGLADITAHVNWTHAEERARAHGFEVAGRVRQERLLLALGLLDEFADGPDGSAPAADRLAERLAAKRLILPGAGGGLRFEALALVRGIDPALRGLGPVEPPR